MKLTHNAVKQTILALAQPERAVQVARFFKTAPGHIRHLPRTTLRYAIERFEPARRRYYLDL